MSRRFTFADKVLRRYTGPLQHYPETVTGLRNSRKPAFPKNYKPLFYMDKVEISKVGTAAAI